MQVSKIVLTAAFITGLAFQLFAQNLITNGVFESGATGWNLSTQTGFTAAVSYPTSASKVTD